MKRKLGWYVGFAKSKRFPDWINRFFKFTHCYAIAEASGFSIAIEWVYSHSEAHLVHEGTMADTLAKLRALGHTVVYYETDVDTDSFSWHIGLQNCVMLTKCFIGVKSWALTPYQLYKALLRQGATLCGTE